MSSLRILWDGPIVSFILPRGEESIETVVSEMVAHHDHDENKNYGRVIGAMSSYWLLLLLFLFATAPLSRTARSSLVVEAAASSSSSSTSSCSTKTTRQPSRHATKLTGYGSRRRRSPPPMQSNIFNDNGGTRSEDATDSGDDDSDDNNNSPVPLWDSGKLLLCRWTNAKSRRRFLLPSEDDIQEDESNIGEWFVLQQEQSDDGIEGPHRSQRGIRLLLNPLIQEQQTTTTTIANRLNNVRLLPSVPFVSSWRTPTTNAPSADKDDGEEDDDDDEVDSEEEEDRWKNQTRTTVADPRRNHDGDNGSNIQDKNGDDDEFVEVEGLFGVYTLPSGQLWVWIAESKPIYNAPVVSQEPGELVSQTETDSDSLSSSWWKIRKVERLHLLHIPNKHHHNDYPVSTSAQSQSNRWTHNRGSRSIATSRSQVQEELRQLTLLRQALKDHDWYFCSSDSRTTTEHSQDGMVVPDMTRNLQSFFSLWQQEQQQRSEQEKNSRMDPTVTTTTSEDTGTFVDRQWWWQSYFPSREERTGQEEQEQDDDEGDSSSRDQDGASVSAAAGTANEEDDGEKSLEQQSYYSASYPDRRFFWNEAVLEPILRSHDWHSMRERVDGDEGDDDGSQKNAVSAVRLLLEWSIPVTSAFVGVQRNLAMAVDKNQNETSSSLYYDQLLISRRSKWRAGTRFTKRGADATGHVANYAETEQVVLVNERTRQRDFWERDTTKDVDRGEEVLPQCQEVFSHVQVRGSIPLHWSSPTDIKTYRPKVRIGTDPLAQARTLRQHLLDQASRFIFVVKEEDREGTDENFIDGDEDTPEPETVAEALGKASPSATMATSEKKRNHPGLVLLNLVDKKHDQGRLGSAMDAVLQAVLDVYESKQSAEGDEEFHLLNSKMIHHEWFDFHTQVKGGHWGDRLQPLLQDLHPVLEEQSYFHAKYPSNSNGSSDPNRKTNGSWQIKRLQTGVVRTNCMDCLDRTNVVQSLFARHVLSNQLSSFSDGLEMSRVEDEEAQTAHRWLWADNADAISRLYAGTPALKRDYTRTGQRTKLGALDDGMNSIQRYYRNNFMDADRQEGIDLMLCNQDFSTTTYYDEDDVSSRLEDEDDTSGDYGLSMFQNAARSLISGASPLASLYMGDNGNDSSTKKGRAATGNRFFPNGGAVLNNINVAPWRLAIADAKYCIFRLLKK